MNNHKQLTKAYRTIKVQKDRRPKSTPTKARKTALATMIVHNNRESNNLPWKKWKKFRTLMDHETFEYYTGGRGKTRIKRGKGKTVKTEPKKKKTQKKKAHTAKKANRMPSKKKRGKWSPILCKKTFTGGKRTRRRTRRRRGRGRGIKQSIDGTKKRSQRFRKYKKNQRKKRSNKVNEKRGWAWLQARFDTFKSRSARAPL